MKQETYEHGPIVVEGGSEDKVYKHIEEIPINGFVERIWVFNGLDRGDIAEMDTEIYDHEDNISLVLRSEHKEWFSHFDAWKVYDVGGEYVEGLRIVCACRTNGWQLRVINKFLSFLGLGELKTRPHWGIRILYREIEPTPPVSPPQTEYMPIWTEIASKTFGRAPHASASYENALFAIDQQIIWDGIRNPGAAIVAGNFPWPYNGIGRDEVIGIINKSNDLLDRLRHFIHFDPNNLGPGGKKIPIGGTWREGKTRKTAFEAWYKEFIELYPKIGALDGIKSQIP